AGHPPELRVVSDPAELSAAMGARRIRLGLPADGDAAQLSRPSAAGGAAGDARPRCTGILSRRRLPPGMRDPLAHSPHAGVVGAVSLSPLPPQLAAGGLRGCADPGGGARPGRSAIRAGRRRAEPMDGRSVASRYGELSLRLRPRLRSVSADILA